MGLAVACEPNISDWKICFFFLFIYLIAQKAIYEHGLKIAETALSRHKANIKQILEIDFSVEIINPFEINNKGT